MHVYSKAITVLVSICGCRRVVTAIYLLLKDVSVLLNSAQMVANVFSAATSQRNSQARILRKAVDCSKSVFPEAGSPIRRPWGQRIDGIRLCFERVAQLPRNIIQWLIECTTSERFHRCRMTRQRSLFGTRLSLLHSDSQNGGCLLMNKTIESFGV